jgi:hypothetical protein
MDWPLASQFSELLQNPKVGLKDRALWQLDIAKDGNGQPLAWSGAFAVVFKGTFPGGPSVALRAFTSEVPERMERYHLISSYLDARSPLKCLVKFQFSDRGIRSSGDGRLYPLIRMDWVEGKTLYEWARTCCQKRDRAALAQAAGRWLELIVELAAAGISHGDLQHGNVLVTPRGDLKLVDYDCMYVPVREFHGRRNLEVGLPPYQHPERTEKTLLSPTLDRFSALFIWVGLRALAEDPTRWFRYVEVASKQPYDKLLFRREDLHEPDQTELGKELLGSADPEVRDLARALFELVRGPLDKVPALEEVLDPFPGLELLLRQKDWDGAVERMARLSASQQARTPATLRPQLVRARQRVERRRDLEQAVGRGDEQAMARLYDRSLLDDYPAAQAAVAVARDAAQVVPVLEQLEKARANHQGRDLVALWDAHRHLLDGRKSASAFQSMVPAWRARNSACDRLLEALAPAEPDQDAVARAWAELQAAGGHPEANRHRARAERLIKRKQSWEVFRVVARTADEATDLQLVDAWKEDLFTGWAKAERERPRIASARQRLDLGKELRRLAGTADPSEDKQDIPSLLSSPTLLLTNLPLCLEDEQRIRDLDRALPHGYIPSLQKRREQAGQRLDFLRQCHQALVRSSDVELARAWQALQSAGGQSLLPGHLRHRAELAAQRLPLLQRLGSIPRGLPIDKVDQALLEIWTPELLDDCSDAAAWKPYFQAARQRKNMLAALEVALAQGDDAAVLGYADHALLADHPLHAALAESVAAARARMARAFALRQALEQNDAGQIARAFSAPLVRQYPKIFDAFRDPLRRWIVEGLMPLEQLGLARPRYNQPPVTPGRLPHSFQLRWVWPRPDVVERCIVAVCSSHPGVDLTSGELESLMAVPAYRHDYENAGGMYVLHTRPAWGGCLAVVWAEVDVGFEAFASAPLVLGRLIGPGW